jgi:hypothetical protein
MKIYKVTCKQCDWQGMSDDLLTAINPFDPEDIITGCPDCKCIDDARIACDEPDCWRDASCWTPTTDGYRQTCSKHRPTP